MQERPLPLRHSRESGNLGFLDSPLLPKATVPGFARLVPPCPPHGQLTAIPAFAEMTPEGDWTLGANR